MMTRLTDGPFRGCAPSARWAGFLLAGMLLAGSGPARAGADPHRGLWVGQVTLNFVNEVPVVLDANNQPVAPDPKVATPTADQAHLRLILHVTGAGEVTLLRDVAVLTRAGGAAANGQVADIRKNPALLRLQDSLLARESDLALVTDERLYGEFPPQPAVRLASAVFDFGDGRATAAVEAVVDAAAAAAASAVLASQTADQARAAALAAGAGVVQHADVATEFARFLDQDFDRAVVNDVADGDTAALADARTAAAALAAWSAFYPDVRGSNMVEAVALAAQAPVLTTEAARRQAAQNTAAAHADLANEYHRFLAGGVFGDLIAGGSEAAAAAAVVPGATAASIRTAVNGVTAVRTAQTAATGQAALSAYDDTRAPDAVKVVLAAIVDAAAAQLPAETGTEKVVQAAAEEAARTALAEQVVRYPVPSGTPTTDYNAFVRSAEFTGSPAIAAQAAARAAAEARSEDPFLTLDELTVVAADAAADALREGGASAFGAAAAAARRELPLSGRFGPGQGDPRYSQVIKQEGLVSLGAAGLTGTAFLPAGHPTNPFRHRRHPDHRYGFDITRNIRLDFDPGPAGALETAGYGVERITGVYREELLGLHKPLGPGKDTGLRVEGRFELNRISLIDALNAR